MICPHCKADLVQPFIGGKLLPAVYCVGERHRIRPEDVGPDIRRWIETIEQSGGMESTNREE
jgi:hypothetical protein